MLKRYSFFIFILIIFILVVISVDGLAVTHIEPARMIIRTQPGLRQTGIIKVTNRGEEEINLKAILYDWNLKDDDSLEALTAGSNEYTLDGLIKFNPRIFKIGPGKTQVVRFTITTPEDITRERRGIVFFEEETDLIDQATGARIVTQVGTAIYVVPNTAESKFQLLKTKIYNPENDTEPARCLLMVENQGETTIRYTINYIVINAKGVLINKGDYKEMVILPTYRRIAAFPIGNRYKSGEYKLKLTLDFFGTDKKGEYTIPFKIE